MKRTRALAFAAIAATLPLTGCQNLSKFNYWQKADGTGGLQATGQSKDGATKFNVNSTTTAGKATREGVNIQVDSTPSSPPPVKTFVR